MAEHCGNENSDFIQGLNCNSVRACLQHIGEAFCFAPYLTGGSAWISAEHEGHSILTTGWHVFGRQFGPQMFFARPLAAKTATERKQIFRQFLPIFSLYDREGKVVYESPAVKAPPEFIDVGDVLGAMFSEPEGQPVANLAEDFLYVKVPLRLGAALVPAKKMPAAGEEAYAAGFPTRMENRPESSKSDGRQFYVAPGHFYSRDRFFELVAPLSQARADEEAAKAAEDFLSKDYRIPNRALLYSSCDVVGGNSGGRF